MNGRLLLLARLRHADEPQECLLIGVDRKGPPHGQSDAIDPIRPWPDSVHRAEQAPKGQVHSVGWCGLQRLPRYPQSNSAFGHEPLDPRYDRPNARQVLEVRMDDQPHFTRKNGLGAA